LESRDTITRRNE